MDETRARVATWWTILRICLEERLVYRADFALGTLMRFLPIVTQIFLWFAVFQSVGDRPIASYDYRQFVAYYLLTMVSRAFSSMPGLASGIARQTRESRAFAGPSRRSSRRRRPARTKIRGRDHGAIATPGRPRYPLATLWRAGWVKSKTMRKLVLASQKGGGGKTNYDAEHVARAEAARSLGVFKVAAGEVPAARQLLFGTTARRE